MIGSKRKVLTIYKELQNEGIAPEKFDHVHAPVGLDIGAITPEEIAVAVVAEMIAVRRHASLNVSQQEVRLRRTRQRRSRGARCGGERSRLVSHQPSAIGHQ